MDRPNRRGEETVGLAVFGALMAIEVLEYFIGIRITPGAWPLLALLAVPGAGVIFWFFMRLPQVLGGGEGE